MHSKKFDELIASLAAAPSRRSTLKGLVGSLATLGAISAAEIDTDAAKRKRKDRNKKNNKNKNNRHDGKKDGNGAGDEHRGKTKDNHGKKRNVKRCNKPKKHCGNKRKCYNLKKSEKHCGSCHNRCDAGETCVQGVCTGS